MSFLPLSVMILLAFLSCCLVFFFFFVKGQIASFQLKQTVVFLKCCVCALISRARLKLQAFRFFFFNFVCRWAPIRRPCSQAFLAETMETGERMVTTFIVFNESRDEHAAYFRR